MRFYLKRYCPLCLADNTVPFDEEPRSDGQNRTVTVACHKCKGVFFAWEGSKPGKYRDTPGVIGLKR